MIHLAPRRTLRTLAAGAALAVAAPCLSAWAQENASALRGGETAPAAPQKAAREEVDGVQVEEEQNAAVVTASGSEESRATASANVISVSWEEIQQRGYKSVADVLTDVPGLYVVDDLVQPSVAVRGVAGGFRAGTRIVKIMINGVPVNFRPDVTAFIGPEYLPIEMVERVEIAKGPLSALHGANAFLATVNVITRGLDNGVPLVAELSGRVNMNRGGAGYGGTLVGGFDDASSSLLLSASYDQQDRSGLAISRTFAEQDPTLPRYSPFFGQQSEGDLARPMSAFGQYRAKHGVLGTFLLQGGIQRLDSTGEFQLNSVLTHNSRVSLENGWVALRHEKSWSKTLQSAAWIGWSRGVPTNNERLYLTGNKDSAYERSFRYRAIDGAVELTSRLGEHASVKLGTDFAYEPQNVLAYTEILQAPRGNLLAGERVSLVGEGDVTRVVTSNLGAYLQLNGRPSGVGALSKLFLTGNVRLDVPNLFPAQFSWRSAAAYRFSPAVTAKLVAGRAFQSPSATFLYGLPGFGSQGNVIGNRTLSGQPSLVPQAVTTVEAGLALALGRFGMDAGVYGQRVNDRIEFIRAGSHFQARNQGEQDNVGVEAMARYVHGRFSLRAGGTLQRLLQDGRLSRTATPLFPDATFLSGLNVALPEAHLNFNGLVRWVSERGASQSNVALNNYENYQLPSYATADLALSTMGLSLFGGAQTTFSLSVRNLFDARYSEPGFGGFDLPVQGRTGILELRQVY